MLLTLAALVAAVALLGYLVWLRRDSRWAAAPLPAHGEERRADHALFLRLLEGLATLDERYRGFTIRALRAVAFVGIGCAIALAFEGKLLDDTRHLAQQQRSGRAIAIDAICGAVSGVVDAGRETILGSTVQPETEFTRALERLGYPPKRVRDAQARVAAKAYAKTIAGAVERATGQSDLTRRDGSLDCSRVKRVAGAVRSVR